MFIRVGRIGQECLREVLGLVKCVCRIEWDLSTESEGVGRMGTNSF